MNLPMSEIKLKIQHDDTKRQSEIIELLLSGLTNKEIGTKLFIAEKTVKWHLTLVYKKHSVKNRLELVTKLFKKMA